MNKNLFLLIVISLFFSCTEDPTQPKPKAYLSLTYEEASYTLFNEDCPYQFLMNDEAIVHPSKNNRECWVNIKYPNKKATIFITYNKIDNNLEELLKDAQKLPLQHSVKADEIEASLFENKHKKTFGTLYEVKGDAASQAQFYTTDSLSHFLTGAIYFDAKPNYDSILPAAEYIKNDIRKLMESLEWVKN